MFCTKNSQQQSVHDFITVPAGANGPPDEVVDLFVRYVEALHLNREEDIKRLQAELRTHTRSSDQKKKKTSQKKRGAKRGAEKTEKKEVGAAHLDEQIRVKKKNFLC
jgi:hypothetical protein